MNYWGDVDFYLLIDSDDYLDVFQQELEEFVLKIPAKNTKDVEIYYSENNFEGTFRFNTREPIDYHTLKSLVDKKEVNIYFMRLFEEEYICIGVKNVYLPAMLCCDIQRFLEGKKPLLLPAYNNSIIFDRQVKESTILKKGWGFYLDFTKMKDRIGSSQETEEIISRHVLDGIARLQRGREKSAAAKECIFIWAGKRIMLNHENIPCEYYNIYISGDLLSEKNQDDYAKKILEKSLKGLPEFERCLWTSPLAEEGLPIACLSGKRLYRIDMTKVFFKRLARLFQKFCLPGESYVSYYQKILTSKERRTIQTKIYNIFEKRRQK